MMPMIGPAFPSWLVFLFRTLAAIGRILTRTNWFIAFAIIAGNWFVREFLLLPPPAHYWGAVTIRYVSSILIGVGSGMLAGNMRAKMIEERRMLVDAIRARGQRSPVEIVKIVPKHTEH